MAEPHDRSMTAELIQGTIDNTYIQIAPDRGGLVELSWPVERATTWAWPQYRNVEVRGEDPFAISRRHVAARPVEPWSRYVPLRQPVAPSPIATPPPARRFGRPLGR